MSRKNLRERRVYQKIYRRVKRDKVNAYASKWKQEHPKKASSYEAKYTRRIRKEAIAHYGGKCVCCGISNYEFLSFDHMKGEGQAHRRKLKIGGSSFVLWLRRNNYPKGIQILCHNCNQSLGFYGFCPHQPNVRRKTLHSRRYK